MIENISVIGVGRLGLSFALVCEDAGFNVLGCDTSAEYITQLNGKSFKTIEPQIEDLLRKSSNFSATISIEACVRHSDLLFCFVATPSLPSGEYDHSQVERVVAELTDLHYKGALLKGKTLVIGCTVMPTYTQSVLDRLSKLGMRVCYNPEFIAQGDIVNGLRNADMVLIGCYLDSTPDTSIYNVCEVYKQIMRKDDIKFNIMSPTAAEITKMGLNCALTTKIAMANMLGDIAARSGVHNEVTSILSAIGDDSRIGNKFFRYGLGYGGVCLPRDNKALTFHSETVGIDAKISKATDASNKEHGIFLRDYLISKNKDKNVPFIFDTIYYKKGTQLLVESQAYALCLELLNEGYSVVIMDDDSKVLRAVRDELRIKYKERAMFVFDDDTHCSCIGIRVRF